MNQNDVVRKARKILAQVNMARRYRDVFDQIMDIIQHKLRINTSPRDYYKYGFYAGGKTWEQKSRYVGRTGSRYWPFENNYFKYTVTLSDKYVQKTLIHGFGLPTSKLITSIGEIYEIRTQGQLNSFLDEVNSDIALKPIDGAGGERILVLSRRLGHFLAGNKQYSNEMIWNHVRRNLKGGFLVEERVKNAASLSTIYPLSLNTFRVVTIKTKDQIWHLGGCVLKFGSGGSQVDNSEDDIQVAVDENGMTVSAYWRDKAITHHPDTGMPLVGIELEEYKEIIGLALKASEKFCFMGTIGWDIALSDRGPLIIEGNTKWSTEYQIPMGRGYITDAMAGDLKKRHMFSRWNRSRMYPNFHRRTRWPWQG